MVKNMDVMLRLVAIVFMYLISVSLLGGCLDNKPEHRGNNVIHEILRHRSGTTSESSGIATVNNVSISKSKFDTSWKNLPEPARIMGNVKKTKQNLLQSLITDELLLQYGLDNGIDETVLVEIADYAKRKIVTNVKNQLLSDRYVPSEEEITKYYNANKSRYIKPEKRLIDYVEIPFEPVGKRSASRKCKELLGDFSKGHSLKEIAENNQKYTSHCQFEKWLSKNDANKQLVEIAYNMKHEGQISNVVNTDKSCILVQLEKIQKKGYANIEEVKNQIEKELQRKNSETRYLNKIEELKSKSDIKIKADF